MKEGEKEPTKQSSLRRELIRTANTISTSEFENIKTLVPKLSFKKEYVSLSRNFAPIFRNRFEITRMQKNS